MNPDLLRRRGGFPGNRGRKADRLAGSSNRGSALVVHFMSRPPLHLDALALDLDPRRRHVAMLDDLPAEELAGRLRCHSSCLPEDFLLHVRFSSKYVCPLDPTQLDALRPRVQFGTPERDVGRYPLIQVADAAAPSNRVRIGRLTALVRAALASANAVRELNQERP